MLDGMKFAQEGMIQNLEKQAVVSNNLANTGTYGFRGDNYNTASFSDVMREAQDKGFMGEDNKQPYVQYGGNVNVDTRLIGYSRTNYSQGAARETGNNFDMMLDDQGLGYFTVKTDEGTRYTRAGNFKLQDGCLVTSSGAKVQGLKGDIKLNGTNFQVTDDGFVKVDGKVVDRFKITTFLNPNQLQKEGLAYLKAPEGAGIVLDKGIHVHQGYLELSNVNAVQEMVQLINVSRTFEANSKVLQSEDKALQVAADQLGKVH
jgi:flagellar basal-body rod protein FlgG